MIMFYVCPRDDWHLVLLLGRRKVDDLAILFPETIRVVGLNYSTSIGSTCEDAFYSASVSSDWLVVRLRQHDYLVVRL